MDSMCKGPKAMRENRVQTEFCMRNSEEQSGSECVGNWSLHSSRVNGKQVCAIVLTAVEKHGRVTASMNELNQEKRTVTLMSRVLIIRCSRCTYWVG